jgi:hypothetical protein
MFGVPYRDPDLPVLAESNFAQVGVGLGKLVLHKGSKAGNLEFNRLACRQAGVVDAVDAVSRNANLPIWAETRGAERQQRGPRIAAGVRGCVNGLGGHGNQDQERKR